MAILLLVVGIVIAYDSFFKESTNLVLNKNIPNELNAFSEFILNLSSDLPVLYGLFAIILAIVLGSLSSWVRKLLSEWRKKISAIK